MRRQKMKSGPKAAEQPRDGSRGKPMSSGDQLNEVSFFCRFHLPAMLVFLAVEPSSGDSL